MRDYIAARLRAVGIRANPFEDNALARPAESVKKSEVEPPKPRL